MAPQSAEEDESRSTEVPRQRRKTSSLVPTPPWLPTGCGTGEGKRGPACCHTKQGRPMEMLCDDAQTDILSQGPHEASVQAPGQAVAFLGPQSLGFLASVPHPDSGHGPISHVLH